jgi:pyruvate dehydrogenase E2 component (dihydrolipoamide acetyltransferase)
MVEFKLPDVGEGIHEAEVLQWLVSPGQTVARDQPMVELQTDKAVVEIPSPVAGVVADIRAKAGTMARVGDVLIVIRETGQSPPAVEEPPTAQPRPPALGISGPGQRVLAAPAVRKLALELGIDLAQVPGSGPAGRVLPNDVRHFANQKPAESSPTPEPRPPAAPLRAMPPGQEVVDEEPLRGLRRRIAERMEQAWQIPHVTVFDEADAAHLVDMRRRLAPEAERQGVKLTYMPFFIKAAVQTLKEFPYFNASLDMAGQKILLRRYYHLGLAVAVPDGLMVPVIRHANRLNLLQLAAEVARLAELARQRKLSQPELSGSTFTITNFGSFGAAQGTPIINPPEVAILGCGRIEDKPVAVAGQVQVRPMLPLALSIDHRLLDGAAAAQFLTRLNQRLSDPARLLLELP